MNKTVQEWFADPDFKALPTVEKERVIGRFFDTTFAPDLEQKPDNERAELRDIFTQANIAPHRPEPPSRGVLADTGVTVARGLAGAGELVLRGAAGAAELAGLGPAEGEPNPARELGQDVAGWREDTLPRSKEASVKGSARQIITGGVESAVTSLAAAAPMVAAGALTGGASMAAMGYVMGAPLFGAAQYDQALEEYTKKGVPKEQAHLAAMLEGASEAGFEFFTDALQIATVGMGGVLTKPGKEAAKNGMKRLIASSWGEAGKRGAAVAATETAGELANVGAQAEVKHAFGVGDERFWGAMKDQFGEVAVASLIFGAIGGGLHKARSGQVRRGITDASLPLEDRLGAVQEVASELERVDPQLAMRWRDGAVTAVLQGKPISDEIKDEPPAVAPAVTDAPIGAVGENVTEAAGEPAPVTDAVASITGKKKGSRSKVQGAGEQPAAEPALGDVRAEGAQAPEGVPPGVSQFTPGMAAPAPGRMVESQSAVEQRLAQRPVTPEEVAEVAPPAVPTGVESLTGRPVESIAAGKPLPQESIAAGTPLPQEQAPAAPLTKKEKALAEMEAFVAGLTPEQRQAIALDEPALDELRKTPATGLRAIQLRLADAARKTQPVAAVAEEPTAPEPPGSTIEAPRVETAAGEVKAGEAGGEAATGAEAAKEPWEMSRDDFAAAHINQFGHYDGRRNIVGVRGKSSVYPLAKGEQRNGKLLKTPSEILTRIHKEEVASRIAVWKRGQEPNAVPYERKATLPPFEVLVEYPDLQADVDRYKSAAAKPTDAAATITGQRPKDVAAGRPLPQEETKAPPEATPAPVEARSERTSPEVVEEETRPKGERAVWEWTGDEADAEMAGKEVWQVPASVYLRPVASAASVRQVAEGDNTGGRNDRPLPGRAASYLKRHHDAVEKALEDGKDVPGVALAGYPELQKRAAAIAENKAAEAKAAAGVPLEEIQVDIKGVSESGAAMMVKERADVALKENREQTDTVRRILDCLNT